MLFFRRLVDEERGLTLVLVAAALTAILGFTALVVDIGALFLAKNRLINACDAAALAAAPEIASGYPVNTAQTYLEKNGIDTASASITVDTVSSKITVEAEKEVNYHFARVLGFEKGRTYARAAAIYGPLTACGGIAPFSVPDQDWVFGQQYTLKVGAGGSEDGSFNIHGNFGALALGGQGAKIYEQNIKEGYNGIISQGEWVATEPGNMSGPTYDGVNYLLDQCTHNCTPDDYRPDCPRLVVVPVYDPNSLEQGRDQVLIVGFAAFFLEGVAGHGNESFVTGTFLETTPPPGTSYDVDPDATDYGLSATKLVE